MAYTVQKSKQCPKDKPWALLKDGSKVGCYETEKSANRAKGQQSDQQNKDKKKKSSSAAYREG